VNPGNPQTWNRYAYVANNPLAMVDPSGEGAEWGLCANPVLCVVAVIGQILELFKLLNHHHHPHHVTPQAPPAPDGGYGAGIDPFGCIWCELPPTIPSVGFPRIGLPGDPACTYGGNYCGGVIYGFTQGGSGSSTWWQHWLDWFHRVPWLGTAFIPIPVTGGTVAVTVSGAHIPQNNVYCLGGGLAVQTPSGKVVSGGPLTTGNLNNAKNILSGWSWSFGGQQTAGRGVQTVTNSSGSLGGPTAATAPGMSAGGGGMVCKSLP
jgi:hypothetical protein